jgi:flagellar basal body rod protein FlgG
MIYGLYLSATGVVTNAYRQDVIANNLANSETVGFKRDVALFRQRMTESEQRRFDGRTGGWSDPLLDKIGGGTFAEPTLVDNSAGDLEQTTSPLDLGIEGKGYFAIAGKSGQGSRLTRDGRFKIDEKGDLTLANSVGGKVLDPDGKPIHFSGTGKIVVGTDGVITQGDNHERVGQIGLFNVPDPSRLTKEGGDLMAYPDPTFIRPVQGIMHSEFVERANVDPTVELTELMDAQRQLEANANMIRYQDQTLQRLVNDVGKIS